MLDGHSFSVESLPAAEEAGGLGFELLTPRTMLVPREAFAGELAASYLAAEGLAPLEGECAVWSDTQQQTVAVMAIDRAVLDALHARPLLNLGLRLGEGTGAICAYPIVDSAVRMLNEMDNFVHASITKYF